MRRVVIWSCLAVLIACRGSGDLPSVVVLISIDTLRADHLGCYGYGRDTSPFLDQLAAESILYEQAFAHAPSTLPSHASLFTSLIPHHHAASHPHRRGLAAEAFTLAEVFLQEGWRTASINGGGQLARELGVAQGFEVYESVARQEDRFSRIVEAGLRWLDQHDGERRFLFLHTFEVHQPPDPPAELLALFATEPQATPRPPGPARRQRWDYSESELAWFVDRYDAEIRSMDAALGELMAALRHRGLWRDALVVLTSDHGEELGDHGHLATHAHTLFDELLRVPLIVKRPAARDGGRRVAAPARLVDVAPTILLAAGITPPPTYEGVDLLADGPAPQPLIALRDTATRTPITAVRTARWKLVGQRLFDLRQDPRETADVASEHPEVVRRLDRYRQHAETSAAPLEAPTVQPTSTTKEQLEALGYIN